MAEGGKIGLDYLDKQISQTRSPKTQTCKSTTKCKEHHHTHIPKKSEQSPEQIPKCGFLVKSHQDGEFTSIGWRFNLNKVFDTDAILLWISNLNAYRVKAVLNSKRGLVTININEHSSPISPQQKEVLTQTLNKPETESRLEVIFEGRKITRDFISNCTENLLEMSN
jgi:hypothetical protein